MSMSMDFRKARDSLKVFQLGYERCSTPEENPAVLHELLK